MSPSQLIANRFELQDLLGRGGMGEVYRAADTQTGETVAVKALNPEVLEHDSSLLERFVREGEALRQLNHPNIVRMIAAVEEEGKHYLVMEFVEGGSLRELLTSRGRLPANEVVKIALEVSDALTRAHHLKIIHRDLKPANVLLAKDNTPRLADFGIAHIQDSSHLTQSGTLIGTVDYLSPEVCQGKQPNELSDIWAFGVMLFEMLSGKLPFEGKSMTAKITAILHQPIPDLKQLTPDIPDALVDLIYRMLEKDSRQRVPSVRLVAAELENILKGRKSISSGVTAPLPSFDGGLTSRPVFVGRENELRQLDKALGKALSGHGQVAFIIGDPGQGKTALLQEFGQRAQKTYTGLVLASGNCNAYTGIGDPYLPFREIMGMLTGDVETLKEAGVIGQTQATRLWNTFPHVIQHLIESGNNLVDIFVSGADLLQRAGSIPIWSERENWLPQLEGLVARKASQNVDPSLQQAALFEQFTRLARALAQHAPLILLLDDLQWADSGSINLLLHLGKKLEGSRVMVVGAYRPTDVAFGRGGERHPLETVVNELKRQFGEIQIDLSQAEARAFVNSYLDTEPNRLDESFREEFFRFSGGHPLMTVELLRDLQERGGLVKDADGYWIIGSALNWESLPARVEATIAERMERLDKQELAILRVAGIQGETFSAEVVSRVLSIAEPEVVTCLSSNLDREHHLVNAQGIRQINAQRMSFYKFRHILFQKYLYNSLDPVERAHLHQQVGTTLQALYGEVDAEIAVQLARHFQEAGTTSKAADYLEQAGDRASELVAPQEAIEHYQEAMIAYRRALGDRWDPLQQAILERKIGESLFRKGEHQQALHHLEQALVYLGESLPTSRWGIRLAIVQEVARQIAHRLLPGWFVKPDRGSVSPAVEEERNVYELIGWIDLVSNPERIIWVALKSLNMAESNGFLLGIAKGCASIGTICDFILAYSFAEHYHLMGMAFAARIKNPAVDAQVYGSFGAHKAFLGEWDSVMQFSDQGADKYREIGDLHGWSVTMFWNGLAHAHRGALSEALVRCQNIVRMAQEVADPQMQCWGLTLKGFVQQRLGQLDEAVNASQQATEFARALPDIAFYISTTADVGRCYLRLGYLDQALSALETSQSSFIPNLNSASYASLRNGMAEACLVAAEQSNKDERAGWFKKASHACREALKQEKGFRPGLPEALRLQGTYEWLRGKRSAAQKWWQRSVSLAEKMGQRYDIGMAYLEMGRRLGDKNHLEQAKTIFTEIGAQWDLEQTQKALSKL